MRVRQKLVDQVVNELLEKNEDLIGPPVNLTKLASRLGVELFERSLDHGIDGLSAIEGEKKSIIVNESAAPNRKRFTIAHELGHLILHCNSPLHVTKEDVIFFRNEESSKGENWREIEANRFSASLLMPAHLLQEFVTSAGSYGLTSSYLQKMAETFGVSSESLALRLGNLGYTA